MYPLKNWKNLRRGYRFGVPTFYNQSHIGLDLLIPVGTIIYAPFDGQVLGSLGPQGGNTATFIAPGHRIRFLHLSKFGKTGTVKEGDIIGYSGGEPGDPGAGLSTAPHVHIDCYTNKYVDPETYKWNTMKTFKITVFGYDPIVDQLKQKVEGYSNGALTIEVVRNPALFHAPTVGMPTQDAHIFPFLASQDVPGHGAIIFYKGNSSSVYASAAYYVPKGISYAIIPQLTTFDQVVHELLHMVRDYLRARGAPIEDGESHPTAFSDAFFQLIPYLHLLDAPTEQNMRLITLDSKDIWLVSKNGKRSLIYNLLAFQLVDGNITQVEKLTPAQFNAIPDSGHVLAGLSQL